MKCFWCDNDIEGWYLVYEGKSFCRRRDDACIKEYLYEKIDGEIDIEYLYNAEEIKMEELMARKDEFR